jgi:uncharacterized protein YjiS (DUF1127 family)
LSADDVTRQAGWRPPDPTIPRPAKARFRERCRAGRGGVTPAGRSAHYEETTMTQFISSRAASVAPAFRFLALLRMGLAAIRREMRIQRDLHQLESLDDHRLHDIGLDRGAIENAVRNGRPRLRQAPSCFGTDRERP